MEYVYWEGGESGKGVIQSTAMDMEKEVCVTGAYVSPTVTGWQLPLFISESIANRKGTDVLIPDRETRPGNRDELTNMRGSGLR